MHSKSSLKFEQYDKTFLHEKLRLKVTCHHGPEECEGNLWQSCLVDSMTTKVKETQLGGGDWKHVNLKGIELFDCFVTSENPETIESIKKVQYVSISSN